MDRRSFFRKAGAVAVVSVASPLVAKEVMEAVPESRGVIIDVTRIPPDMTVDEILEHREKHKVLLYQPSAWGATYVAHVEKSIYKRLKNNPVDWEYAQFAEFNQK